VQKKKIETGELEIVGVYCDICGDYAKCRHCKICHRDLCNKYARRHYDEWGDGSINIVLSVGKLVSLSEDGNLFRLRFTTKR